MTTLITPITIRDLSPGLFAFAYRAVRQREEAEDLVQEAWLSALRTAPSFEGRSTLRTWLISILRRRMADRFRRAHRTEPLEEEEYAHDANSAQEQLEIRTAASVAADALAKLTELERDAVLLCDVQDLDRDEASERMGVTRGHLRVLLHRGRHKLEQTLAVRGIRA